MMNEFVDLVCHCFKQRGQERTHLADALLEGVAHLR